jgi:FKBP-type peptidyl-prolyl cis-trans isomerase FklB
MKQFFLGMCVLLTATTAEAQAKKKPATTATKGGTSLPTAYLKNSLDSFSYALGVNIANNLKMQQIDKVNAVAMQKAMADVFNKKGTALNDQQCNAVIQSTLQGTASKRAAVDKVKIDAEKAKGQTFLAANKKRDGVIELPGGLQYEVITKGDPASAMPKLQDTFVAHYAGTLIDGKEFDNSYKRGEPITYPVTQVVRGWTEALQLMHIGDKWKLYIPSELGYGDRGSGAIPGGATLVFEIELVGIKPAATVADDKK